MEIIKEIKPKYADLSKNKKLEYAQYQLRYEEAKGIHTYHKCPNDEHLTRSELCTICWREEIKQLKK